MRRSSRNRSFLIFFFTFSLFFIVGNNIKDVKSAPVSSQNPILFVHGYSGNAGNWNTMKLKFYYDGWPGEILRAFTFSDTWNGTSEGNIINAQSIENWVDELLNDTGADKVDIIAHSMGGLSSRYYLKFLNGSNKVDDFVCLGSPQHG
ncbi:MAG: esterase/lipase family protein, partial [Promethearchaeota archaeon]